MFVSRVGAGDTSIWDTASFSRTNIPTVMNPCGGGRGGGDVSPGSHVTISGELRAGRKDGDEWSAR